MHGSCLPWRLGTAWRPTCRSGTVWYALGGLGALKRSGQGSLDSQIKWHLCAIRAFRRYRGIRRCCEFRREGAHQSPHINTECAPPDKEAQTHLRFYPFCCIFQLGADEMEKKAVAFAIFLINSLAARYNQLPSEVYRRLVDARILDEYIIEYYDVLHTQGVEYLLNDISSFLEEREHIG